FGDLLLACSAGDRRAYGGVAEVDVRALDRRLRGLHGGVGAALRGQRVVEVGLRDEALRREAARARGEGAGVSLVGARLGERGLRFTGGSAQRRGVDLEQHLAFLD